MEQTVYDSTGKIIGKIEITENAIIIHHFSKPLLVIEDNLPLLELIKNKDESGFIELFEKYTLLIGEIAALYGMTYSTTRKHLIKMGIKTKSNAGRRNSSYGRTFSEERKRKIGEASRGRKIPQYERTPEIRNKISEGLKKYYATHEISDETRAKLSEAWVRGCYSTAKMGRGYSGFFYSKKNDRDFFFRSLLELSYIIFLEEEDWVETFSVEPFQIKLPNGHHYTPDILINGTKVVELKPSKHLTWEDEERWNIEIEYAVAYCVAHNYDFEIVYDTDIDFDTRSFKRWLLSSDALSKYNIRLTRELTES